MRILGSNLKFGGLVLALSALVAWWSKGLYPADVKGLDSEKTAAIASAAASVASTVASVAATMLGFLIAALAILASIAGMRLLRNMQRTGHYQNLLARLFLCAAAFSLLLAIAVFAMFAPLAWLPAWQLMFGCMAASVATFLDAMRKFAGVLFALRPTSQILE